MKQLEEKLKEKSFNVYRGDLVDKDNVKIGDRYEKAILLSDLKPILKQALEEVEKEARIEELKYQDNLLDKYIRSDKPMKQLEGKSFNTKIYYNEGYVWEDIILLSDAKEILKQAKDHK